MNVLKKCSHRFLINEHLFRIILRTIQTVLQRYCFRIHIGPGQRYICIQRNMLLSSCSFNCMINLPADAQFCKMKKTAFFAVKIPHCFKQADHSFLHQIISIPAKYKDSICLFTDEVFIFFHQKIHHSGISVPQLFNQFFVRKGIILSFHIL